MPKSRLFITYKHQEWTFGDKENLVPMLDGDDDYIIEALASDTNFAVILRNGKTYKIKDNEKEAKDYIAVLYRFYSIEKNEDKECFINRYNTKEKFLTSGDAMKNGIYDYVYVPTGHYLVAREGKVLTTAPTEVDALNFMYKHSGVTYTYIS